MAVPFVALIVVIAVVLFFIVFAGKKKKEGDNLGDPDAGRNV